VPTSTRAIARCGAGVNNIPVEDMTKRGIPVFNSPGANANSVKELVLCSMLLSSRRIVQGIAHVDKIFEEEDDIAVIKKRVEKDKSAFGGQELTGKTVGIIGLGHIGALVANASIQLGMNVIGYDPALSVESAWKLPGHDITRATELKELLANSDYITLHVPYIKGVTHHLLDAEKLRSIKPTCNILNFSRGELIDSEALLSLYNGGHRGTYVLDFPDEVLHGHSRVIEVPHLGASTGEAEINSAAMAADEVKDYLEHGIIRNSVNFPTVDLPRLSPWPDMGGRAMRMCVVNNSTPGVLGKITNKVGDLDLNIIQAVNASRGEVAYNVLDLDLVAGVADRDELLKNMMEIPGVLSCRLLIGDPGTHFRTHG